MKFSHSLLVLGCLWVGTSGGVQARRWEKAGAAAAATPAGSSPDAPLSIQWAVGDRLVYRMDIHQHHHAKVPQMPKPIEQDVEIGLTYALAVVSVTDDGGRELELEFIAYETEMTMGGQTVLSYDSKDAPAGGAQNPMASALRHVVGSKIRVRTRAEGQVDKVLEFDAWRNGQVGGAPDMAQQMFDQTFNEGYLRQLGNPGIGMPGKVIPVGGSWPVKQALPAGPLGEFLLDSVNTLRRYEDREKTRCAVIDMKGTVSTGRSEPGPMGVIRIDKGTRVGTLWLDPVRGRLVESNSNDAMQIRGTFPGGDGGFTSDMLQTVQVRLVGTGRVGK